MRQDYNNGLKHTMADIYQAASQGNLNVLRAAVAQGYDINAPNQDGKTPLWFAANSGQEVACSFLIAQGVKIGRQSVSVLQAAIDGGHIEVIATILPYCNVEGEYRLLEDAISLGFHDIADILIETENFQFLLYKDGGPEISHTGGFPGRKCNDFRQWERFLSVRCHPSLPLDNLYFEYGLILAASASHNSGLRMARGLLQKTGINVNRRIRINSHMETPLTAAAEKGNLEVLALLSNHPDIDLAIRGKYNWPASFHLLASSQSVSTERGLAIAQMLLFESSDGHIVLDDRISMLTTIFKNVLQSSNIRLAKHVIGLVRGSAGLRILPLLVMANEKEGLTWLLNYESTFLSQPSPALWVLLCDYLQAHPDPQALSLFIRLATFFVEAKLWHQIVLKCLQYRNFDFVKQFFHFPFKPLPQKVMEETLDQLPEASTKLDLIKEWVDEGFANVILWNAIHLGLWHNPSFKRMLSHRDIDPNLPDPHSESMERPVLPHIHHAFFNTASGNMQIVLSSKPSSQSPDTGAFQDYQSQLMLLEKENRGRSMNHENKTTPLIWAIVHCNIQLVDAILCSPRVDVNVPDSYGRTPLMYAIAVANRQIVERLLTCRDIELNLRDKKGRTAVFYAAQSGDLIITRSLVERPGIDLHVRDFAGHEAVKYAQASGQYDIVAAFSN